MNIADGLNRILVSLRVLRTTYVICVSALLDLMEELKKKSTFGLGLPALYQFLYYTRQCLGQGLSFL